MDVLERTWDGVGNFFVRHTLQFAQHNHLTKLHRQFFEGLSQQLVVGHFDQQRFWIGRIALDAVYFFVERSRKFLRAVLLEPGVASVTHNCEQPGASIRRAGPWRGSCSVDDSAQYGARDR